MKVWVECLMISVTSEQCYQGQLTMGACELVFKMLINNDLYETHYDELNGEYAEDVDMGLIRKIVNIMVQIEDKPITLTDEAYGFITILLMSMKERLEELSSGSNTAIKTARFSGEWDFPPNIKEYLDPMTFLGVETTIQ
jgi:hypothetical protein